MSFRNSAPLLGLVLLATLAAVPAAAATQVNFDAQLFGQNEIPGVATEAYGSCVGVLDELEATFTLSCEHTMDPADTVGAHVHRGFGDENGAVVFDLGDPDSPVQAVWNLDEEEAVRLLAGGLYVNVHTTDHPDGEIRGQLRPTVPTSGRRLPFPVRGTQVVPSVDTPSDGACVADVELERTPFQAVQRLTAELRCAHDLANPTGAVIRRGAPGEEGEVVVTLESPLSPFETSFALNNPSLAGAFLNGDLYLEITSLAHPDGALRGQMEGCLAGPNHLCLNGDRFQVAVNWITETDAGEGFAVPQTDDSGLFWFFRPSNLELLVKVLDGCGVNDHYWVFLAGTTNVGYNLTVTDTATGFRRTYENTRGTLATTRLDTEAFATCP